MFQVVLTFVILFVTLGIVIFRLIRFFRTMTNDKMQCDSICENCALKNNCQTKK